MTDILYKPKAIIWDWDGTVVSSYAVIRHALLLTLSEFNIEQKKAEIALKKAGIISLRDFFPDIFGEMHWEEAKKRFYYHFEAHHLDKLTVIANINDAIQYIHTKHPDIHQCIVSNKRGDLLRKEVEHVGLSPYFTSIIGATDAAIDKPDIAPLIMALVPAKLTLDDPLLIIGDSSSDLELAANAGCQAIYMNEEAAAPSLQDSVHTHVTNSKELLILLQHIPTPASVKRPA